MAMTKQALQALGLTEEQAEAVSALHAGALEELRGQLDLRTREAREAAQQVRETQTALDTLRRDVELREDRRQRETAYAALLREAGVSERHVPAILRVAELSDLPLSDPDQRDLLLDHVRKTWEDFIPQASIRAPQPPTPPVSASPAPSRQEILAIPDREQRRAAIAANLELF